MKLTTEQIQRAYVACFGRSADVGGFEYWKQQEFENEAQIYQLFINSDEGQGIYSNKTDEEIIEIIYQNALGRSAEPAGKTAWLEQWHTQGYGLDTLIQNITQSAINNGELTQTLINNAINETKITQINLASVITLDRPATAQEIKENINKDCYTYNYVKIYSQTIEFMANGGSLNQILQNKIDFNDLNTQLDNAIKSDVPTDHNYFFSKDFQMVKLLISAWEYPQNYNSQVFSNEILISKETGLDMLKHIDNSSSYVYKLFKYNNGLDLVKQQLKETATELTSLKDLTLIPKYVNIIETLGSKEPQQELTIQFIKFTDNLNDGILNNGDYLTLSFTDKIKPFNIEDLNLSNNHNFGSNAMIEPINPDKNGYTSSYKIILGNGADIASGDIITINKDKIIDINGNNANENIKLALIDILSQNTPPISNNNIIFNDTQNDNILNANDSLTITFNEPINTKNLKISDFILSNHSFGKGAYISPVNADNSGFTKEIKIILGDGANIVDNDIITIKKDKIIDKGGLSATKDIKFILENIPNVAQNTPPAANSKVKFSDTQNDGLLNQGDTLTISFTEKIKTDALKIEDISLNNNTHSFGDNAQIVPKNVDNDGYATEFEIILGENVNLDNNDKLIIDKNSVIDKEGLTPNSDIQLNLTDILPTNLPPKLDPNVPVKYTDEDNNTYTNKDDTLKITFNEKIDGNQLTIDDLTIESGNSLGEGATIVPVNPDENGFATEFKIILGDEPTIEPQDVLIIDKDKIVDEGGLTPDNDIRVILPDDILHNIVPPAFKDITYTDKNADNFTNKGDVFTISFNEQINSNLLNINDLIFTNGAYNFGDGAILQALNANADGFASEFEIILGKNPNVVINAEVKIDKVKVIGVNGINPNADITFNLPLNLLALNEPPEKDENNAIKFTDENSDNYLNKGDSLTLTFNEPIKTDEFNIDDLIVESGNDFGDGATIQAIDDDGDGYCEEFKIIFGENPTIDADDVIIIDKEKIIDKDGLKANIDAEFPVPDDILPPNEPPAFKEITFTDKNNDNFTNKGDVLKFSFNEKIKADNLTIDDLIVAGGTHNFGEGAVLNALNLDPDGNSATFEIILGKNATILTDDPVVIDKSKVVDTSGLKAAENIEFNIPTIPQNNEPPTVADNNSIIYTDTNTDNFTNKGDTLTLSFNELIKAENITIENLIISNGHNVGTGASIQAKNTTPEGYAREFDIILGENPTILEDDVIVIDKNNIIDTQGLKAAIHAEFIVPELFPANEPPRISDNNSIVYTDINADNFTNKTDTLTLSFNEKIKTDNLTIADLIVESGNNFGEDAFINFIDDNGDGYASKIEIVLGKNPTILENDVISIDKNKIEDKDGLKATTDAKFIIPELFPVNEPPAIDPVNAIKFTDENADNFTNKGDSITLTFNEAIKADFDITDLILNNGHTFGDGATLEPINEVGGYAKEYKIILGSDSTITKDDVISIDKEKVVDTQGLNASENIEFIVPNLLPHNEPPAINPVNAIVFTDVNADNFTNKTDSITLSFNEPIKVGEFDINDLSLNNDHTFGDGATLEVVNEVDGYASEFKVILGENPTVATSDVINIDKEKIIDNQGLKAAEDIKFIVPTLPNTNEPPTISPTDAIKFTDEDTDNFTNSGDSLTLTFSEPIKADEFTIDDLIVTDNHNFGNGAYLEPVNEIDGYASEYKIILGENSNIEIDDEITINKDKIIDKDGLNAVEDVVFPIPDDLLPINEPPAPIAIYFNDVNTDGFTNSGDTINLSFNESIKVDAFDINDLFIHSGHNFGDGAVLEAVNENNGYANEFKVILGQNPTIITNDEIILDKNKIIDSQGLTARENAQFIVPNLPNANEPPKIADNAINYTDTNADNFTNKGDSITLTFNEPIKTDEFDINDLLLNNGHSFGEGASLVVKNEIDGYASEFEVILGKNPTILKDDVITIDKEKVIDNQGLKAAENIEFIIPQLFKNNEPPTINPLNSIIFNDENADNFVNKNDTLILSFNEAIKSDAFSITDLIIESGNSFGNGATLEVINDNSGYASEFKVILGQNPTIITSDVINIDKEKIIDVDGLNAAEDVKFIVPTLPTANEAPTISPTDAIKFVDENADEFTNKGDTITLKFNEPIKASEITLDALNLDNGHSFGDGATIIPKDTGEYSTEFVINLGKNPTIEENDKITIDKEKVIDNQGLSASENIEFIIPELKPLNEPPTIDPLNSIVFVDKNADNFTNKGDSITLTFNEPIKADEFTIDDLIVAGGTHNFGDGANLVAVDDDGDGYAEEFEIILGENATVEEDDVINIDKEKIIDKDGLKAAENIEFVVPELKPKNEPPKLDNIIPIEYKDENNDTFANKGDNLTIKFNEPIEISKLTLDDLIVESGNDFGEGASLVAVDDDGDGYATEFQVIFGKEPTIEENDIINIDKEKIVDKDGLKAENDIQLIVPHLNPVNEPPEFNNVSFSDTNADNFTNAGDKITFSFNEKIKADNLTIDDLITDDGNDFGTGAVLNATDTDINGYATTFKIVLGTHPTIEWDDIVSIDKNKIIDVDGLKAAENIEFAIPHIPNNNEPPTIAHENPITFTDDNLDHFTNKGDYLLLSFNEPIKADTAVLNDIIVSNGHSFGEGAELIPVIIDNPDYIREFKIKLGKGSTIEKDDTLTIPRDKIIDFDGLIPATDLVFIVPELLPVNEPPEFENVDFIDNDLNSFTNKDDYLNLSFNEKIKVADLTIDSFEFENDTHTFGEGASLVAVDDSGDGYASEFKIIFGKNINLVADEKVVINKEKVIDIQGLKAAENIEFNIPTNLAPINEPPSLSDIPITYEDKNNDNFTNKNDGLKISFNEPIKADELTIDDLIVAGGHNFGNGASLVAIDDDGDGYAEEFEIILGSNPTIEKDDVINIDKEKIIDKDGLKAAENIQLTIPEIYPVNEPPVLNSIVFNDEDSDGFAYTGDSLILTFNEKIKISELKLDEISIQDPTHTFGNGASLVAINDDGGYANEFKIFLGNNANIVNNDILTIPKSNIIDKLNLSVNQNAVITLNNIPTYKPIDPAVEYVNNTSIIFTDENSNDDTDIGDTLTLIFDNKISKNITINDLRINNGTKFSINQFGFGATIEPIIEDDPNYVNKFKIILGSNPIIKTTDIISINKDKIFNEEGASPNEDTEFITPELIKAPKGDIINALSYYNTNVIYLNFNKKIKADAFDINDLIISNGHNLGTNAQIHALNLDEYGYTSNFQIALGDDKNIEKNDTITIDKNKIIDEKGLTAFENVKFTIPSILETQSSGGGQSGVGVTNPGVEITNIVFDDINSNGFLDKGDELILTASGNSIKIPSNLNNFKNDNGNDFGIGAKITKISENKFKIIIGDNSTIESNDTITIPKEEINFVMAADTKNDTKFNLPTILPKYIPTPDFKKISYNDLNINNIIDNNDNLTIQFNTKININNLTIDDLIVDGGTHNFGENAQLIPLNEENGYTNKFAIILGTNPTIIENDIITIDKNKISNEYNQIATSDIQFNIPVISLINNSNTFNLTPTVEFIDKQNDKFVNKGDILKITFNEKIKADFLNINDFQFNNGYCTLGENPTLEPINEDINGFASQFEIILGKNPMIFPYELITLNKSKFINSQGYKLANDITLEMPEAVIEIFTNEPPETIEIKFNDENNNNFTDREDSFTITFNKGIKNNFTIDDIIFNDPTHNFGEGAKIIPITNSYATTSFKIKLGKNANISPDDIITIKKEKIMDDINLQIRKDVSFTLSDVLPLKELDYFVEFDKIEFKDVNNNNYINKEDCFIISFENKIKADKLSINDFKFENPTHTFGDNAKIEALEIDDNGYTNKFKITLGNNFTILKDDNIIINKDSLINETNQNAYRDIEFKIPEIKNVFKEAVVNITNNKVVVNDYNNITEFNINKFNSNTPINYFQDNDKVIINAIDTTLNIPILYNYSQYSSNDKEITINADNINTTLKVTNASSNNKNIVNINADTIQKFTCLVASGDGSEVNINVNGNVGRLDIGTIGYINQNIIRLNIKGDITDYVYLDAGKTSNSKRINEGSIIEINAGERINDKGIIFAEPYSISSIKGFNENDKLIGDFNKFEYNSNNQNLIYKDTGEIYLNLIGYTGEITANNFITENQAANLLNSTTSNYADAVDGLFTNIPF